MILPENFHNAMYHFVDAPNTNYHWLHKSKTGIKRTVGTFRDLSEMDYWLSQDRFDEYDHYLSPYSFNETESGHQNYVTNNKCLINSVNTNKIYCDFDPKEGEDNCIYLLPSLRKMQRKLPCTIVFSGRGYQTYHYLDKNYPLEVLKELQAEICRKYDLPLDPRGSPISRLHVMRMPYTRNSKSNRWTMVVRDLMTPEDVDYWSRQDKLKYCYFSIKNKFTIEQIRGMLA